MNANESGPSFFVLFNPDIPQNTKVLPFSVYESALPEGDQDSDKEGKFVQLDCGIETGEAERIAVDGVTKDGSGEIDQSGGKSFRRVRADDAEVASLTMQGNAIAMLYDRALVLLRYVSGVVDGELPRRFLLIPGTAKVDHDILRQIGALVATLPVMDVEEFHTELETVGLTLPAMLTIPGVQRCAAYSISYDIAATARGICRREFSIALRQGRKLTSSTRTNTLPCILRSRTMLVWLRAQ